MADAAVPMGQAHITAHDPHHLAEADLVDKGLAHDSVGLVSSIALGLSSVAPAYALTATLGPTVTEAGLQMPAIFLLGFLPMVLVAVGYRELNRVAPDAGLRRARHHAAGRPVASARGGRARPLPAAGRARRHGRSGPRPDGVRRGRRADVDQRRRVRVARRGGGGPRGRRRVRGAAPARRGQHAGPGAGDRGGAGAQRRPRVCARARRAAGWSATLPACATRRGGSGAPRS